ncbi:hypothetical protein ASG56_20710 [Rhodococcus sp. Leaf7]|uniref:zf-HC2 domain-containing protein n=1 Tax=unclassified Rhodococcus (in: high G+C Gram-positive bacteria) TaxID=192944 RepID=UPI0006F54F4D|nr:MULTISPECIES: zf-HC2 domain-containing protein [unclassified Rhodococcus (in: high G+C Gram-positive bacteria)]KQU01944.1 hypothetical protein ASG56_20710 [Rhodococcus sp. Leaf7]KQU38237.1 hypothetical protein ASG64_20680 [Rhodococcus sp. Leaf247]
MDCTLAREALSARIDGEREPVPSARTDEHLESCARCQNWYASATELTRSLRVGSAPRTPDLTAQILDAVGVRAPRGRPRRVARWVCRDHPWRAALVLVAMAQISLGVAQLLGVGHTPTADPMAMGHESMAGHLFNESTAWNIAVGIGFLVAAWRPAASAGLMPVLVAFTGLLAVFVITDSISGQVTIQRVASHAIIAVGVAVTAMVRRSANGSTSPSPQRVSHSDDEGVIVPDGARQGRRRGHLREADDSAA